MLTCELASERSHGQSDKRLPDMARTRAHTGSTSPSTDDGMGNSFSDLALVSTGAGVIFASFVGIFAGSNSPAAVVAAVVGMVAGLWVWRHNQNRNPS